MFRKLVSNLAFSPALVGQLGFYAKRLRKEETTRRIGLIFTALALVVQSFAVLTPPESANAANGDNIIYGGVKSKSDLLGVYDRNADSAGHKDLQQIYSTFGITRQDIVNGSWTTFNSRDFNSTIQSVGRSTYSWQRAPYAIGGTSTTVYGSLLYKFDSSSWTLKHGSMYYGVVGKRAVDGQWFAIMSACGNPAFIKLPPPPPQPAAICSALTITPVTRTKFSFTAKSAVQNNAKISGYKYTIKDAQGATVMTKNVTSNATSDTLSYDFQKDGSYTTSVIVSTSVGDRTSSNCQKALTVSPQPRCTLNPDLTADSPDCKSCQTDSSLWYKDASCKSDFTFTKTVKNVSQLVANANNTTALPGDRLEYHLTVKNVGKTTGTYTMQDNLGDVLEYADLIDSGGGTVATASNGAPVEQVGIITWPSIQIQPDQSFEKIVNVQVKAVIPATAQSPGNIASYDCRMNNEFGNDNTTVLVNCPAPKVVEAVVTELPHTGASENMLFAGIVLSIVVYFYARSRQMKKEVRLIRRDLNAGTI
ncbi:MAG TPA: hypothetical protein VLG36_02125 [Candidatus Chromulinivoraceae bacterium]|nr:hypothetical protein [Candidatus Chromulinivoraceae bacterium]